MMHRGLLAGTISLFVSACGTAEEVVPSPILETPAPFGRLPSNVRPVAYEVELRVDPRETTFGGVANIAVELDHPSDGVWLHGNDLRVASVFANGNEATYEEVLDTTGVSRIIFDRFFPVGTVDLEITYEADFDRNLAGLFRVEEQGDAYALAKSESIQARRFLPGFDEPGFKAPFDISLIVPEGYEAISNTPAISRSAASEDGFDVVVFDTTRPLSTYLLSVAVGPFDVVEYPDIPNNDVRDTAIPLRGFARRGRGEDLKRALDTTAELVEIFETALNQPYPYKKLDIVAAPAWPSGATELAGAITYRESRILLDENSGPAAYRAMLQIHTHEIAHMWFGNLVTPPWWDDLWLKEAFATWGTPLSLTQFRPDAGHDVDATVRAISAMDLDSLVSTRAVREDILRNRNIRNAYDSITYSKGMAVIAMADTFFGPDLFRLALGRYIAEFADGEADSPNFYDVIGRVTGEPKMTEVFESFVEQKGVPLLSVAPVCEPERRGVILEQSRYAPLGSRIDTADTSWKIPLCVAYGLADGTRGRKCSILEDKMKTFLEFEAQSCPSYILPNADGAGYFRWSLAADSWTSLTENFDELSTSEALSTVDSAVAAFKSGESDVDSLITVMEVAARYRDRRVAIAPMSTLEYLVNSLGGANGIEQLRSFAAGLYRPEFNELKDSNNADEVVLAAQLESFLALTAKDEEIRRELAENAVRFIGLRGDRDPAALTSDRYEAALIVGVQDLGAEFFEALVGAGDSIDDPRFDAARAVALSATIDSELSQEVRDLALSGSLGPRETDDLIRGQMFNPETRDATWNWLRANYSELVGQLPSQWRRRTPDYASVFCDVDKVGELEVFFEEVGDLAPGYERALAQTAESIELCAALKEARADELIEALQVG
ncbi:MAG: M1 family metallopeptidase [Pseudomonadota bacterium]